MGVGASYATSSWVSRIFITEVGTSYNSFSFVTSISSFCASGVVSLPAKEVTELSRAFTTCNCNAEIII